MKTGIKRSQEFKDKVSKALKGRIPWNKGKKMPRYIVEKQIKSNTGKKRSLESRKKMSVARMGIKLSDETKEKIGKFNRGRKRKPFTEEHCKNISEAQKGIPRLNKRGENCHLWKGGITDKNKKIRTSIEFKVWRETIFKRDKFLCQMPECSNSEKYLQAHHIRKFSDYEDLRLDINNGITLCKDCHNKTKWEEDNFISLFEDIINTKQYV